MSRKISDEVNEQIKVMYLEDMLSGEEIARRLNVSPSTVLRRLKKMEIPIITHRQAGIYDINEVIKLYNDGIPIHKIATMFKSSQETISKKLKENDVKVFSTGMPKFNQHIFDNIDTEEKAYWLGFIYADGYIAKLNMEKINYAFSIGLAVIDVKHLEKFNTFMEYKGNNTKLHRKNKDSAIYNTCR